MPDRTRVGKVASGIIVLIETMEKDPKWEPGEQDRAEARRIARALINVYDGLRGK